MIPKQTGSAPAPSNMAESILGKIKKVTDDGVIIRGPYNEEGLDWEDVITYNKALVSA